MISPPRPRMPPLNSLRAFEAAARLNSIAAAASELCVTPAAVAQQVKSLEQWAGEKLFDRQPQGVELTQLGASVLMDFSAAFDALGVAVQKLRLRASPHEVRIAALPSVAQYFLSPRLPLIRKHMPEISISVSALETKPNLVREPFDLAIFYAQRDQQDRAMVVSRDSIFPVCSPATAARLKTAKDLAGEILLHDTTWRHDWQIWLTAAGHNISVAGPQFSLYSLALEECKNGAGVLIGHEALVRHGLADGSLVEPFSMRVEQSMDLKIFTMATPAPAGRLQRVSEMLVSNS